MNDLQMSVYKITNRGFVGIACQWLPVSTNNLPIDNYCTIMFLTKLVKTNTLFHIGKLLVIVMYSGNR